MPITQIAYAKLAMDAPPSSPSQLAVIRGSSLYATTLICITVAFLFADQNLLAPNLTKIAHEFSFTDQERDDKLGGQIAFGFFVLGGPVALIAGALADTSNRCVLFGLVVLFGFATYFTTSFEQLFWCRVLTGISIGGASPIIYSLMADIYSESSRIYVSTLIGIAMSFGVGFGQLLAGVIADELDDWRLPFLLVSVPAMLLGLLFLLTVQEPRRGEKERAFMEQTSVDRPEYSERIDFAKLKALLKTPSALIIFAQGIPGCVPWGVIYSFLNDYLALREASIIIASSILLFFAIGGGVGQLVGGYAGQLLFEYDRRLQCILMGVTTALSAVPMMLLINVPSSAVVMMLFAAACGLLVSINPPNVRAVLQDVCYPECRGTAFAFFNLTDDIGKGGGPMLVALLIRSFGGRRRPAFNVGIMLWVVCGAMLCALSLTVLSDERDVQAHVAARIQESTDLREDDGIEEAPVHNPMVTADAKPRPPMVTVAAGENGVTK